MPLPLPPALRALPTALALTLAGCATGPPMDSSHQALGQDSRVQFIVIHYTVGAFPSALKTLTQGRVSSHYLVDVAPPTVYRLVDEQRRAWHAGLSSWQGQAGLNAASVGIEIVNRGFLTTVDGPYAPFPPAQVDAVVALVKDIAQRHGVKPHRIVGHSDVAPQHKQDPGPMFPWQRLVTAGLVPWPDAAAVAAAVPGYARQLPEPAWFQQRLAQHGFAVPSTGLLDEPTRRVLQAFQMKYRPSRYDGQPDAQTAALLAVATRPGGLLITDPASGRQRAYQP